MKLNVICLYRTGGKKYIRDDVLILHDAVERVLVSVPHNFVCMTNDAKWETEHPFPLLVRPKLPPGWWGKPYVFRIPGPALYLDLDTWLMDGKNLSEFGAMLCRASYMIGKDCDMGEAPAIWMLESFRWLREATIDPTARWASGIMAWTGDWSWVAKAFQYPEHADYYGWDQRFLSGLFIQRDVKVKSIQDHMKVYSYKRHCRGGVPEDADIVCFHGRQTPRKVLVA